MVVPLSVIRELIIELAPFAFGTVFEPRDVDVVFPPAEIVAAV
jgi:hypothetical protein